MYIMATAMHNALVLGSISNIIGFQYRQRIHIGSKRNDSALRVLCFDQPNDTGCCHDLEGNIELG